MKQDGAVSIDWVIENKKSTATRIYYMFYWTIPPECTIRPSIDSESYARGPISGDTTEANPLIGLCKRNRNTRD